MQGVVASGSVSKLRWLLNEQHAVLPQTLCDYAAVSGSVEALSWLRARGRVFTADAARVTAEAGHTSVLHFLKLNGYPFDVRATAAAAAHGNVAALRWLHEHGCPWRAKELCHNAAATNRVQILQYVLTHAPDVLNVDLMLVAVERGSLDACRLLLEQGCPTAAT
jgi:CheY-like chemotaxis protein